MTETVDPADLAAVTRALREFIRRCDELHALLAKPSPHMSWVAAEQYRSLKHDLGDASKRAAKYRGTVPELVGYGGALRRAHIELRPPATARPTAKWLPAVGFARSALGDQLVRLEASPPGGQRAT